MFVSIKWIKCFPMYLWEKKKIKCIKIYFIFLSDLDLWRFFSIRTLHLKWSEVSMMYGSKVMCFFIDSKKLLGASIDKRCLGSFWYEWNKECFKYIQDNGKSFKSMSLRFQQAAITSILNKGKQLINYFKNVGTEGLYLEISWEVNVEVFLHHP